MNKGNYHNPIVSIIFYVILIYIISSIFLNNIYQKDFNFKETVSEIKNAKNKENLEKIITKIKKISNIRLYLLSGSLGIIFLLYLYFKIQTDKSESTAIIFAICLSLSGKLIEKLGLNNCLNVPIIDPKGSPSNVLLFDMFYTNFFAYFIDFIYAFVAVILLSKKDSIFDLFKKNKFSKLIENNILFYSKNKIQFKNIFRFLIYIATIIVFWNWGSIIRPKISVLLYRYLGIPIINTKDLVLEDQKDQKEQHNKEELIYTNPYIGIISASIVEGLIFTGFLFPMRKYFLYNLENNSEYNKNKLIILAKFLILILIIPACVILFTKYTLSSDNSNEYRIQKMISITLLGYIMIPFIFFMMNSIFKFNLKDIINKQKNILVILYIIVPIIIGITTNLTDNNSFSYITDDVNIEKEEEKYMSESIESECDESQNKYKYSVLLITFIMLLFSFGPLFKIQKLQPLTGFLYLIIICIIVKIIYMFQDNYEPYNILNPMRHSKISGSVDLDSVVSIEMSLLSLFVSVISIVIFRKFN